MIVRVIDGFVEKATTPAAAKSSRVMRSHGFAPPISIPLTRMSQCDAECHAKYDRYIGGGNSVKG